MLIINQDDKSYADVIILIKGKYTKKFFLFIKKENGKLLAVFEIVEKNIFSCFASFRKL